MTEQSQMNCVYLAEYTQLYVIPLIHSLKKEETHPLLAEGLLSYALSLSMFNNERDKRRILTDFSKATDSYADTEHQWISDSTENKLKEIGRILRDMELPIKELPKNCIKMYYDLMHLKETLEDATRRLHCNVLEYIIGEMDKCVPNTANHFELLLKNGQMRVYYNRLIRLAEQLERSHFDDDDMEYRCKAVLMRAFLKIQTSEPDDVMPIVISDEIDEFTAQWGQFAFDNQAPTTLYPRQKLYRNEPYIKTELDTWLFAHRVQLKFMNGDEYWRKSPGFQHMDESVRFAFYNYAGFGYDTDWLMQQCAPIPERTWDLAVVPPLPATHVNIPNKTFKKYYDETVAEFCNCVETSHALRTSKHLARINELAGKIRTMSEWMVHGIDNVSIERYMYLAPPHVGECPTIDMSDNPVQVYRKLIDHYACVVCTQDLQEKIIKTLKICGVVVV